MALLTAILSALGAVAALALKWLQQEGDVKSLKAQLEAETARADMEAAARLEKDKYAKELQTSLANHLKDCRIPLSSWANQLRRGDQGGGEAGPVQNPAPPRDP